MIPNSIAGPSESLINQESPEHFRTGVRNVMWLTVRDGRKVILKGLPEELKTHPEEIARLRKEYSLGLRINHPGIVGIYGFETHPKLGPVIIMEFIDGITLDDFLGKGKKEPLGVRLNLACKIADALEYMHSCGIWHRDLKPDNILVTGRKEVKIIDIGLGDSEDSVIYKQSIGTLEFGAPEQQKPYTGDFHADVYSFGKILELLLPETRFRKLRKRCLQKEPEKRITMQEALDILRKSESNSYLGIKNTTLAIIAFSIIITAGTVIFLLSRTSSADTDVTGIIHPADNTSIPVVEPSDSEESFLHEKKEGPEDRDNYRSSGIAAKTNIADAIKNKYSENTVEDAGDKMKASLIGEEILEKYETEMRDSLKKYGCAFDAETEQYNESIVNARVQIVIQIYNRMLNEIEKTDLSFEEKTRLCNIYVEEFEKTLSEIDGR